MKRALDLIGVAVGAIVLIPVGLLIIVAIRFDSPGRAVFSQRRVGRNEQTFTCHKFRSMHIHAPERPTHESAASDVTRMGRFLRRAKLDELPQLVNVLRGEMTLVGPRPCLPSQTELIDARRRLGVMVLRPGITGLAQVNGVDMSDPVRLAEVDAEYVRRQSLWLDLRLISATLLGGWLRPSIETGPQRVNPSQT